MTTTTFYQASVVVQFLLGGEGELSEDTAFEMISDIEGERRILYDEYPEVIAMRVAHYEVEGDVTELSGCEELEDFGEMISEEYIRGDEFLFKLYLRDIVLQHIKELKEAK